MATGRLPSGAMRAVDRVPTRPTRPVLAALRTRAARATALVACALAVLLAACASGGAEPGDPFGGMAGDGNEIEILVRNMNFNQVTVYTARSGTVRRLGTVPGKGEATFTLNWYLPDIQLRVKELAGDDYLTETLPVSPGEYLELIIPAR